MSDVQMFDGDPLGRLLDDEEGLDNIDDDGMLNEMDRLEMSVSSEQCFVRQTAAKSLASVLQNSRVSVDDAGPVFRSVVRLSDDPDGAVRVELARQLFDIATCCSNRGDQYLIVIAGCILPTVIKLLSDTNGEVRNIVQQTLLNMINSQCVQQADIDAQVLPTLLNLLDHDSPDDYRAETIPLMIDMIPICGPVITETAFLPRFLHLCTDPLFQVRKACAVTFGKLCQAVSQEMVETMLLPKFAQLCDDGVWGVRKACAECFAQVATSCSVQSRSTNLIQLYLGLVNDQSRWVRMSAFQALGAFICSFADPRNSGFRLTPDGTLLQIPVEDIPASTEQLQQMQTTKSESKEESSSNPVPMELSDDTDNISPIDEPDIPDDDVNLLPSDKNGENQETVAVLSEDLCPKTASNGKSSGSVEPMQADIIDTSAADTKISEQSSTGNSEVVKLPDTETGRKEEVPDMVEIVSSKCESGNIAVESQDVSVPPNILGAKSGDDAVKSEVVAMDVSETVPSSTVKSEVISVEQMTVGNNDMVEISLKSETETSATVHSDSTMSTENVEDSKSSDLVSACSIMDSTTISEPSTTGNVATENGAVNCKTTGKTDVAENAPENSTGISNTESAGNSDGTAGSNGGVRVLTASLSEMSGPSEETVTHIGSTHVHVADELRIVDGVVQPVDDVVKVDITRRPVTLTLRDDLSVEADYNFTGSDSDDEPKSPEVTESSYNEMALKHMFLKKRSGLARFGMIASRKPDVETVVNMKPTVQTGTNPLNQTIVPNILLDHYISMTDPSRVQTVDSEIAYHCAYSLPAVAYTLGRRNWPYIRELFLSLARDMQWKVRRTLAFSLHRLAIILGDEITCSDLLPIFDELLHDVDEVRTALVQNLSAFLQLLPCELRNDFLPKLMQLLNVDNVRNWRYRVEVTRQLEDLFDLFSIADIHKDILPVLLHSLAQDPVSQVRRSTVNVLGCLCWRLSESGEAQRLEKLVAEFVRLFAHNSRWLYRQLFVILCDSILSRVAVQRTVQPAEQTSATDDYGQQQQTMSNGPQSAIDNDREFPVQQPLTNNAREPPSERQKSSTSDDQTSSTDIDILSSADTDKEMGFCLLRLLVPPLLSLHSDPVANVRIAVARSIALYIGPLASRYSVDELSLFATDLNAAVNTLRRDSDRDVRYTIGRLEQTTDSNPTAQAEVNAASEASAMDVTTAMDRCGPERECDTPRPPSVPPPDSAPDAQVDSLAAAPVVTAPAAETVLSSSS